MIPFYEYSKAAKWTITLGTFLIAAVIVSFWTKLLLDTMWWALTIFFLAPVMQFLLTPFFTSIGVYQYLSPMLLVYSPSEKKYDLHNGTSFDYLLMMRSTKRGTKARHKLLGFYLEGLLKIIEKITINDLPKSVLIRGSSYFFSERTGKRLGFNLKETDVGEKINIYLNYIDLLWMYSFAHGQWRLPNLQEIKTAEISGEELVAQKDKIIRLKMYLEDKKNESA